MTDKMMGNVIEGYIDLQLTPEETQELISILNFTITSSKLLADQELVKGTYKGAAQMNRVAHNATKLLEIVATNAQIGSPPEILN